MKSTHAAPIAQGLSAQYPLIAILAVGTFGVSLFFALVSPFGAITYLSFPERFMYWLLTSFEIQAAYVITTFYIPKRWVGKLWHKAGVASLIATPFTFITIISVQSQLGFPVPPQNFGWMASFIWPICFAVAALFALIENSLLMSQPKTDLADKPPSDELIRARLPIGLRNEKILALAAQDHYVEVHTAVGSHLVHMRLNDAEQFMPDGIRVHRSWWVAAGAVDEIRKIDRQTVLHLKDGLEVPASKSGVEKLREAGWL